MSMKLSLRVSVVVIVLLAGLKMAFAAEEQPIDVIEDNSFLIEEAYNQDPGVVQHIFNAIYVKDSTQHGWQFSFTQEWPVYGLDHQLSYTIPSSHLVNDGDHQNGIGDVLINYRYQALEEGPGKPAFAPRFSLILPTGSRSRGTGNGVVGYQWSLPFSKKVGSRLALHANLGLTYLPHVQSPLSSGHLSPKQSLVSYNIGGSAIFAILPRLHAMLEWIGSFEDNINNAGRAVHSFNPVISPGFRTAVVNEEDLQIVVGAAAPIGLNRSSNNLSAFLYFSVEHKLF
jgi:hypothetical protein